MQEALAALLRRLSQLEYRFTTVTPETHARVLARSQAPARNLRDVLGWNRPFDPSTLPAGVFEALAAAGGCVALPHGLWRATLRVSSVEDSLFVHSGFPTDAHDAVFFGPDSYRFARAIRQRAPAAKRAVDVGCGSGVGGIVLAQLGTLEQPVVLADINQRALQLAEANARHAGTAAECLESDVLRGVTGGFDLVIANPPYLNDPTERAYRHGGGSHGLDLSLRIVREALERLDAGGTLLLYTGVAIVDGVDPLWAALEAELQHCRARYRYDELDPDVFGSELEEPAYGDVERIAAVLLQVSLS
jgi:methylase of polypeptide subunit release factors